MKDSIIRLFVTIEKKDELQIPPRNEHKVLLRGCIGTYLPTRVNIAEEIIRNAIAAATEDYRFGPIREEEFSQLSYTVYILNYPEPVEDIKKLNPKKFGIIVKTSPFTYPNENAFGRKLLFQIRNQCTFSYPRIPGENYETRLSTDCSF